MAVMSKFEWGKIVKAKTKGKKQAQAKNADLMDWLLAIDASLV